MRISDWSSDVCSSDLPPSMIVSVNRSASLHAPLSAGANFCINVLSRQQEEISRACGGKLKGEERFALGKWLEGVDGVPVLADSQASIVCKNEVSVSYGTTGLFIGQRSEDSRVGKKCVRPCRSRWWPSY